MSIYKQNCRHCGNYYEGGGMFYCSMKCYGKATLGRKLTSEQCKKISQSNLGRKLSEETKQRMSESKCGDKNPMFGKHPLNTFKKGVIYPWTFRPGKEHRNWKGGTSREKHVGVKYDAWRSKVFERDNYTCQACGYSSKYDIPEIELRAHHIFNFKDLINTIFEKHIYNIDNGITLCVNCHGSVHWPNRKFSIIVE